MRAALDVLQACARVRQAAPLMRLAKREANARTNTAQKKLRAAQHAEQQERVAAYIDSVYVWCSIPSSKRKPKPPSPSIRDFGIKNELKAMNALFRSEKWLALINGEEPREIL
jgi:hypothetical protein